MNPMKPEEKEQVTKGWAYAGATSIRFQEVKQATMEACSGISEAQKADHGQVAAWLDCLASNGQLRVTRTTSDEGRIACHIVEILEVEDGEVHSIECGGYVYMSELRRGYCGGTTWLKEKEEISEDWVQITVMITDTFPDHPMFKRADGTSIDLGPCDDHFHLFQVTIHNDDIHDQ